MKKKAYRWAAPGDVNAFFGLMLDNIADLVLTVSLLGIVFGFPTKIALSYMVPGTAIGVLVGDLLFFIMALRFAKRTGRQDVTAMPLGLDTPSTFGMVFFVLGPAFLSFQAAGLEVEAAAIKTWHVGICLIVLSGIFKLGCAAASGWIRNLVPRAGLLGSLAAVALVLISFLPALEVLHLPVVGFLALAVILTTLVARIQLPLKIPGALGALLIAGGLYYLMWCGDHWLGWQVLPDEPGSDFDPASGLLPTEWLSVFRFEWMQQMGTAFAYLPIAIPFALATVIGGIDCTESAAAAGDDFDTKQVVGVEAIATLIAGLCGGVIQTTPYIGHPAYKAMGGRAAYSLATAIFVGSAGLFGFFGYLYAFIPKAAVFPILIFIGLEITAQSFRATKKSHYPAVVFGCIPALASLVMVFMGNIQGQYLEKVGKLSTDFGQAIETLEGGSLISNNPKRWIGQADQELALAIQQTLELEQNLSPEQKAEALDVVNSKLELAAVEANPSENQTSDEVSNSVADWNQLLVECEQHQFEIDEALQGIQISQLVDPIARWRARYQSKLAWLRVQRDLVVLENTSGSPSKGIAAKPDDPLGANIQTMLMLSNNFILTSLIWGSALATIIDRRLAGAAIYFAVASGLTLFGLIHSPLPDGAIFLPWNLTSEMRTYCLEYSVGYLVIAVFLVALGFWLSKQQHQEHQEPT